MCTPLELQVAKEELFEGRGEWSSEVWGVHTRVRKTPCDMGWARNWAGKEVGMDGDQRSNLPHATMF